MRASLRGAALAAWLAGAAPLLAAAGAPTGTDIEPPEPPPAPADPAPLRPAPPPAPPTALDRYQDCFQRMIDAGASDNAFMRRCLGLPERPKEPARLPNGELEFLGRNEVVTVVRGGLPGLKECYDKLLEASVGLGLTPEGPVDARFDVLPDGKVDGLAFDQTSMTDLTLLGCFRQKILAWSFPRTAGERTGVRLSLRLSAKGGKKPVGTVAIASGFPKVTGPGYGISPQDAVAVFRNNVPKVRACYDELIKHKPKAGGRAIVELSVNAAGQVARVGYKELSVNDQGFKACLTAQLKTWRFPKPRGGEPATVTFPPLNFVPNPPAR